MFATSSSFSWLIGGITESYARPLTVILPLSPRSTAPMLRFTSAIR